MKRGFLILAMTVSISGCAGLSGFPKAPFNNESQIESTRDAFDHSTYKEYYSVNTPDAKKLQIRNEVVNKQIRAYDIRFSEYERDLAKTGIALGLGTDLASLALSGLTATVGGATVKAALGAANAGIVGAKGAINKEMFLEKTLPVIMVEIASQRAAVLLQIRRGLSQNDLQVYGLDQGLSDVQRYADAGSIAAGLNGVLASSGEKLQATKAKLEELNKLTTLTHSDDLAGRKLEEFWMPGGKVDVGNKTKLEAEMSKLGLTTGPGMIGRLIIGKEFADMRIKIVTELGL